MESIQKTLYDLWYDVGDFLYNTRYIGELWDFYDVYPQYVESRIKGRCSLTESLNFSLDEVEAELKRVRELLNEQYQSHVVNPVN